jgi:hypothetical protein
MRGAKRDGGDRYLLAAQDASADVAENVGLEDHMRTMLQEGGFMVASGIGEFRFGVGSARNDSKQTLGKDIPGAAARLLR